ncbi:hypothetical protein KGF57_001655 [Candida theae]|uniref:Uncharacterized protein n=1 Tax=Candida theae TaxID=1198502 RepID=A0AAD5BGF4_9ASCO|nr:uncharacterized protein KGF57_001655 [Candida theae]KAI5961530.1 hypothetical protein KGF57_001655 [Candida theae]
MNGKASKEQQMAQQVQNNKKREGIESIPEGLALTWKIETHAAGVDVGHLSSNIEVEEGDAIYNESVSSNDEGNSRFDGDDSKFVNNTDWDPDHQISE